MAMGTGEEAGLTWFAAKVIAHLAPYRWQMLIAGFICAPMVWVELRERFRPRRVPPVPRLYSQKRACSECVEWFRSYIGQECPACKVWVCDSCRHEHERQHSAA
jgi:hypothetical protein